MNDSQRWGEVEGYLAATVVGEDDVLAAIRARTVGAGLRPIEVSASDGALLALWCRLVGARRVLEVGTLGGYSATWLARAVGVEGSVTTLELDPRAAEIAQENWRTAGVDDRVEVIVGPAADTLASLVAARVEPYDLVFIDADKRNNPTYLEAALELTRPGSVIVIDNVVRGGRVVDESSEPDVVGTRRVLEMLGSEPRLLATAVQTVSSKGWDGFAVAYVLG
ncbi:MAG TPA: O-methyltransferase [Propionibacteriaceae bacterium]|nr:O-methyltransferase [Propionibacteriaceae bacterium]